MTPVTAAIDHNPVNPEFELLHPRGRDGKWIKKGGHVKVFRKGSLTDSFEGVVDDVASDGSINVTLSNGRKVNVQPNQVISNHEVARLDVPASTDSPAIPDLRDHGNVYKGGPTGNFGIDSARVEELIHRYAEKGLDTETLHDKVNGKPWKFRRDREKQHEVLIHEFLNKPTVKSDRKILIMGGLPGAGKSTFLNSQDGQSTLGVNLDEYVMVNPDDIKTRMIEMGMAPNYPGLTADESAVLLHNESSQIAWLIMHRALGENKNIAYDATLRDSRQALDLIQPARDREPPPHEITMVMIDVAVQDAIQRAIGRYEGGDRFLPTDFINKLSDPVHGTASRKSFEAAKHLVDRAILVDNRDLVSGPKIMSDSGKPATGLRR